MIQLVQEVNNIAKKLYGASYFDTLDILTDLKVRINSFGNNVSERYDDDAHIWEVIKELEKKGFWIKFSDRCRNNL